MGVLCSIAFIVFVVFAVKVRKNKKRGESGKKNLRICIVALVLCVVFAFGSSGGTKQSTDNTARGEADVETETETSREENSKSDSTEDNLDKQENTSFELLAGTAGAYGREVILNEGTEFEDKEIGYFVPAGTYKITNVGDYPSQVTVYNNETHVTEEGWEEWTDGNAQRLEVNESVEMTVEDGYFISINEPTHLSLEKIE